jgi:hypothetical protein
MKLPARTTILSFMCFSFFLLATDTALAEAETFLIAGWRVRCSEVTRTAKDIRLKDAVVNLYSMMNSGQLHFPLIVLGPDGTLLDCTPG